MVVYLRRANDDDVRRLRADPSLTEAFVFEQGEDRIDRVEFDKAWHALHFLLTGQAYGSGHPLGIIADETPTECADEETFEFGGFAVIDRERMKAFASNLSGISDEELASRFDPGAMVAADIYIADAFAEDEPADAVEYILQGLPDLRRFANSCADRKDGAIRYLA